ncbi:P-loop containing nucleoside triphosphate hydrolase protein [Pilobolus umbonatus]|nr:P-loop containing nucleoside triphosphate hydrolase protein [Pilobolus umbonatus]
MLSEQFIHQLNNFHIHLDEDVMEYMCGMLNDMSVADKDEIRESTETFLIDANLGSKKRDEFYEGLMSSLSTSTTPNTTPTAVKKRNNILKEKSPAKKLDTPEDAPEPTTPVKPKQSHRRTPNSRKNRDTATESSEPTIVATSQQSRFHQETLETLSKEVDLPGVNISINNLDLLVDAHLRLKACTRYGLVGQNGAGKSVLMHCLADNILVGLPQNVTFLHVSQLEQLDEYKSIVDEILSADKKAVRTRREYDLLQSAMNNTDKNVDSTELHKAIFAVMELRLQDKLDEANRLATKRSGLRGKEARKDLVKIEKEMAEFKVNDPDDYVTNDMTNTVISEVFEKYQAMDQEECANRAQKIAKGLGFTPHQINSPISSLSGGWRMRIALAKSLFIKPDVLLLDEPTNHLDLHAILWLQEYIKNDTEDMTVVVVSHDREFLNNVTEETIILKDKQLKYFAGNYQEWEINTEEQRIRKQALLDVNIFLFICENTEKKRKQIMSSIQHNLQQAKSTGDDKRHGMVNSRRKKLDRLGMEKTEDGKRFKVSYRAGYHLNSREDIAIEKKVKTSAIKIPEPAPLRYHGSVLYMKDVSFWYEGKERTDVIKNFSITIKPNARVAFMGPNGCGKTTLLNMLTGMKQPKSGEVYRHNLLRIGYFSQHIVDQLSLDLSPVEFMMRKYPALSDQECRAHFGTVGISGNLVLQKVHQLSGGQRNRVAFALILYEQPHVLVLDEITNHLDMGTIEILVEALNAFSGALVLVSHDIWFLKQLLEEDPEREDREGDELENHVQREVYTIKGGKVAKWEKGLDAYVASVLRTVLKK